MSLLSSQPFSRLIADTAEAQDQDQDQDQHPYYERSVAGLSLGMPPPTSPSTSMAFLSPSNLSRSRSRSRSPMDGRRIANVDLSRILEKLRLCFYRTESCQAENGTIDVLDLPYLIRDLVTELGAPPDGSLFWESVESTIDIFSNNDRFMMDERLSFRATVSTLCNDPWKSLLTEACQVVMSKRDFAWGDDILKSRHQLTLGL